MVEVRAGRGTITVQPTPDRVRASLLRLFRDQPIPTLSEMERMMELREVLEEAVAALAAVRATPEDLQRISSALDDMAAAGRTWKRPSKPICASMWRWPKRRTIATSKW
jgi:DNA-binding FadR family transcriptional regulator